MSIVFFFQICNHHQDIYCRTVHDLDLDLYNGPRSSVSIANWMPKHKLLFDGYSNFHPICHHFKDINCLNIHYLDLDLSNGRRSTVTMPNESPYMTCCSTAMVIFSASLTISKIFIVEMCMTLTVAFRIGEGQMWLRQSKSHNWLAIWWQFYHICHHFQDIHCRNVNDLDLNI